MQSLINSEDTSNNNVIGEPPAKLQRTSNPIFTNPLLTYGIISEETASILMPPPQEILVGRKRPLRIKSRARVMTSPEVIKDLENQKNEILTKQLAPKNKQLAAKNKQVKKKVTQPVTGKKLAKSKKLNTNKEDHHCHVCQERWDEETTCMQKKWVGCEKTGCPKWACPRCLPENFEYKKEYFCDTCTLGLE